MAQHSASWQEGFDDGYQWYTDAKNMGFAAQLGGFGIPDKPHRFDDDEYNQGVQDGIAQARASG